MISQVIKCNEEFQNILTKELLNSNIIIDTNKILELVNMVVKDFEDGDYPAFITGCYTYRIEDTDLCVDSYFEFFSKEDIGDILAQLNE